MDAQNRVLRRNVFENPFDPQALAEWYRAEQRSGKNITDIVDDLYEHSALTFQLKHILLMEAQRLLNPFPTHSFIVDLERVEHKEERPAIFTIGELFLEPDGLFSYSYLQGECSHTRREYSGYHYNILKRKETVIDYVNNFKEIYAAIIQKHLAQELKTLSSLQTFHHTAVSSQEGYDFRGIVVDNIVGSLADNNITIFLTILDENGTVQGYDIIYHLVRYHEDDETIPFSVRARGVYNTQDYIKNHAKLLTAIEQERQKERTDHK